MHMRRYIDIHPSRHLFYTFVESTRDPANDPVLLWVRVSNVLCNGLGCKGCLNLLLHQ